MVRVHGFTRKRCLHIGMIQEICVNGRVNHWRNLGLSVTMSYTWEPAMKSRGSRQSDGVSGGLRWRNIEPDFFGRLRRRDLGIQRSCRMIEL